MAVPKRSLSQEPRPTAPKKRKIKIKPQSHAELVLLKDVERLRQANPDLASVSETSIEQYQVFDVWIKSLSSAGDGLGLFNGYVCVVPFTVPGDLVTAKAYFVDAPGKLLQCDLETVLEKATARNDSLVQCKYFGKCSGCQLQMLGYSEQLDHKRLVVLNAFHDFGDIPKTKLPVVGPTIGSPLQYKYRTKITPHFDLAKKKENRHGVPNIGFNEKGRRRVMDIEDCPIATDALNAGLAVERENIKADIDKYKRGATLLLRQDSVKSPSGAIEPGYVTDGRRTITEYISGYKFESPAGAFFQNNNSIMPLLTDYVKANLCDSQPADRYLVDAYCGSGLFSVICGSTVKAVKGVEIAQDAVTWARKNATANGITNAEFIVGSAEKLFEVMLRPRTTR